MFKVPVWPPCSRDRVLPATRMSHIPQLREMEFNAIQCSTTKHKYVFISIGLHFSELKISNVETLHLTRIDFRSIFMILKQKKRKHRK